MPHDLDKIAHQLGVVRDDKGRKVVDECETCEGAGTVVGAKPCRACGGRGGHLSYDLEAGRAEVLRRIEQAGKYPALVARVAAGGKPLPGWVIAHFTNSMEAGHGEDVPAAGGSD